MSYAQLGQSCQTSMDVLTDNKKFFSVDDPIYDLIYTRMLQYPVSYPDVERIEEKEEVKEDNYNLKSSTKN